MAGFRATFPAPSRISCNEQHRVALDGAETDAVQKAPQGDRGQPAVQLLKAIEPQLEPLLRSPVADASPQAISQVQPMPTGFRKPANIETEGIEGSSD